MEFPHQGAAKPNQNPLLEKLQLHGFANQRAADEIALPGQADAAVLPHLADTSWIAVFPGFRRGLKTSLARFPAPCRHLHTQGRVRTDMVIFVTVSVQPALPTLPFRFRSLPQGCF